MFALGLNTNLLCAEFDASVNDDNLDDTTVSRLDIQTLCRNKCEDILFNCLKSFDGRDPYVFFACRSITFLPARALSTKRL